MRLDGVRQAAAGLGLRAIHGAEMALEDGRHVTLLVEDATGWRNLCRIVTAAHVHDRDKDEPPPRVPWTTLEEHAAGLVCLSGCARQGVHDEAGLQRLHGSSAPTTCASSSSARSSATTARGTPRWRGWPSASACRRSRPATSTPTRARAAPLQDAFVALRNHATLDASEPLRRGNFSHVLASPKAMAARFKRTTRTRSPRRESSPTA